MLVFATNIIDPTVGSNEFFTLSFVMMVVFLWALYRLYKWVEKKGSPFELNDNNLYSMDNYMFNFESSEVAIASGNKKLSLLTRLVVMGLILLFIVTPMYKIITLLEPINNTFGFMTCFPGLQQ